MASIAIIITYLRPLTRKTFLRNEFTASKRTASTLTRNGYPSRLKWNDQTDAQMQSHEWRNFLHRCSQTDTQPTKFLNGWGGMGKRLKKVFLNEWTAEEIKFFERMWSNSQTTEENYNIILITILHQAPLRLYKIERLDHFLIWYYIEIHSVKNKVNLFSQQGNINPNVCACLLLFCVFKKTFCHATISTTCNAV